MKPKDKFVRSICSPSADTIVWSVDSAIEDDPKRCESCNVEARHSKYELEQASAFDTTEATSAVAGAGPILVKNDLAGRLASVLEHEADPLLAVSTLSILSAVACQVAAEYAGESLRQVAERFVRGFELALTAAAGTKRSAGERGH